MTATIEVRPKSKNPLPNLEDLTKDELIALLNESHAKGGATSLAEFNELIEEWIAECYATM